MCEWRSIWGHVDAQFWSILSLHQWNKWLCWVWRKRRSWASRKNSQQFYLHRWKRHSDLHSKWWTGQAISRLLHPRFEQSPIIAQTIPPKWTIVSPLFITWISRLCTNTSCTPLVKCYERLGNMSRIFQTSKSPQNTFAPVAHKGRWHKNPSPLLKHRQQNRLSWSIWISRCTQSNRTGSTDIPVVLNSFLNMPREYLWI